MATGTPAYESEEDYPVDFTPSVPDGERERMEIMYDRIQEGY